MPHPHHLSCLTTTEAVADAVYRALIGFDRNDLAIFDSAFIDEDVIFELRAKDGERKSVTGLSALKTSILEYVGPMDTTHALSNIRVQYREGEQVAYLTAYAQAQHCPAGRGKEPNGPKYMTGGEYFIDLVKDHGDGLWKIKRWIFDIIWRQGDASIMQRPESE